MTASTKRKLKVAQAAIEDLFGDTTVPQSETREALEELESDIEIKLGGLKSDMGDS